MICFLLMIRLFVRFAIPHRRRVLAVVLVILVVHRAAAQTPMLVRVVVLDTSGSMAGSRMDSAKAEILSLARSLPPSVSHPIVLVPFHKTAHNVRTFTDLASFEQMVSSLPANGGTSIASGLRRAISELGPYRQSSQLILCLFTDGEDDKVQSIADAEEELNKFLAVRSQQKLSSLVFAKRWEGANAALLRKIVDRGNAQLIDAGELKIVPVTLKPNVRVDRIAWHSKKPLTLEVIGQASIDLQGVSFDSRMPLQQLRCTYGGANFGPWHMIPGQPSSVPISLEFPVTTDVLVHGTTTLHFSVERIQPISALGAVALPQVQPISVPISIPATVLPCKLSATWKATKPPKWSDSFALKPTWHGLITGEVVATSATPWHRPLKLRAHLSKGTWKGGTDTIELSAPGPFSFPIAIEGDPIAAHVPQFSVSLTLRIESMDFQATPSEVLLVADSPLPDPIKSTMDAKVVRVGTPTWVDLAKSLAEFDVDAEFNVQGPLPANTKVLLHCPPSIPELTIHPGTLREGMQLVRLKMIGNLPIAPGVGKFSIQVQPPANSQAIEFPAGPVLDFAVSGLDPVQLAILGADGQAAPEIYVRDRTLPIQLVGTPTILAELPPNAANGLFAEVRFGSLLGAHRVPDLPIHVGLRTPVSILHAPESFFFDSTIEEVIDTQPSPPVPAVVGSKQTCRVTFEAPFKRLLFWLVMALSAGIALALLIKILAPRQLSFDDSHPEEAGCR